MARQLRPRGIRSAARGPSRSRVLGLRGVQVPRGRGLGDRPARRRRRARGAVPPHRGPRGGSAGGRRLPEHAVRATGAGGALVRPRVGPRAVLPRAPVPAAVARARTRPVADDGLVRVARRAADLVCEVFGEGREERICGHAEVEVGLAELGRALGSRGTSSRRGCSSSGTAGGPCATSSGAARTTRTTSCATPTRCADTRCARTPLRRRDGRRGRDGDAELLRALGGQWDATVERRTYVTGGQGSHHQDEAFGDDWELPADRAYSETCGRGIRDVQLAPAAREGRPPLRRPDRAHALQRGGDLAERVGHRVLLREHPAPAPARLRGRCRPSVAARPLVAARAVVRRVVLPAEHGAHVREPRGLRGDGG